MTNTNLANNLILLVTFHPTSSKISVFLANEKKSFKVLFTGIAAFHFYNISSFFGDLKIDFLIFEAFEPLLYFGTEHELVDLTIHYLNIYNNQAFKTNFQLLS